MSKKEISFLSSQIKNKIYLVDVSAMFFRAFYALPPMNNSEGFPTNAIYGHLSMTSKLLKDYKPSHMVYCLDLKSPSFRKELDPRYKANRGPMPEELGVQIPFITEFTKALGIPMISQEGYEADDIIGSLATQFQNLDFDVEVVSGDKDFAQLVTEQVILFDPMKNKRLGPLQVFEKWGVRPDQFRDYLALIGDSSDNIPGVRGVGPKTAQKLLESYHSLDGIYENIDSIKGSTQKKLIENKDEAYLSQKLVSLVNDLDLFESPDEAQLNSMDQDHLVELFKKFEFKTLKAKILGQSDPADVILNQAGDGAKNTASLKPIVLIDELKSLPKSLSFYWEQAEKKYLFSKDQCFEIAPELKSDEVSKHCPLIVFDWKSHIKSSGEEFKVSHDLMLILYVIDPGPINLIKSFQKHKNEELASSEVPQLYGQALWDFYLWAESELKARGQEPIYKALELPLVEPLFKMENKGVLIEPEVLNQMSEELKTEIENLQKQIYEIAGSEFNINSPKQLSQVLFEDLGLEATKKTKTGYSTDSEVLEALKGVHPIGELLLHFRESSKLKSTYVDALPRLIDPQTHRIHTQFRQAFTTTGRLSSLNPNLQNIPIRTEKGREIRKAFIAPKGHVWICADYSQIELRLLAHVSEDSALIKAFQNDLDIHSLTAAEVFDVRLDEVTKEQRRQAKAVNFGIAYGQGVYGLAVQLGVSRAEAKQIIESYFDKFPGVKSYMDKSIAFAREHFYVETFTGRRRYLQELKNKSKQIQNFGERAAINAPIQGGAADIVKMAMIQSQKEINAPMVLQIHDELIFEVKESEALETAAQILKVMEGVGEFRVPLKVNVTQGPNWKTQQAVEGPTLS